MSDLAILAENLGKKYLIGHDTSQGKYQSLRETLRRQAGQFIRSAGDILQGRQAVTGDVVEEFWALNQISFKINVGDVVGIIGRNGAGKSTLLKLLSRITDPTEGRAKIRGRVASLLEIGTGFHPELTGRENIFLNGAILGMTRNEIKENFDDIVAFAEVEKFLDTPVKRYSSGMYVRLAFAVAAHLESEILLVDEVLAVGDAEFQKKCLGKMSDLADGGRTVLFVSHNMAAIASLTSTALVLDGGRVVFYGPTERAISAYSEVSTANGISDFSGAKNRGQHTKIRSLRFLLNGEPTVQYVPGQPFQVELEVETDGARGLSCEVLLLDARKAKTALGSMSHFEDSILPVVPGVYRVLMSFTGLYLASGTYSLDVTTSLVNHSWDHYVENACSFEVLYSNVAGLSWDHRQEYDYGNFSMPFSAPTRIMRIG